MRPRKTGVVSFVQPRWFVRHPPRSAGARTVEVRAAPLKLNVPQLYVLVVHRPDVHLWDEQHDARVLVVRWRWLFGLTPTRAAYP